MRRRRERRQISGLGAFGILLLAGVVGLLGQVREAGVADVTGGYGSVLLRQGASSYVMVGIIAFVAGIALTLVCYRVRERERRAAGREDGALEAGDARGSQRP